MTSLCCFYYTLVSTKDPSARALGGESESEEEEPTVIGRDTEDCPDCTARLQVMAPIVT